MAAWSSQIGAEIFARRLLDQPVVLFRNEDGEVLAFEDKCPHRFAPLRFGKRTTDGIECGYHGLRFDRRGVLLGNDVGSVLVRRQLEALIAQEQSVRQTRRRDSDIHLSGAEPPAR